MALSDTEMSGIVLANIVHNEWYATKVMPYVQAEYFETDGTEKAIAEVVIKHYHDYSVVPSVKEVVVGLRKLEYINQLDINTVDNILGDKSYLVSSNDWLIKETESFVKRKKLNLTFVDTFSEFENGELGDDFAHKFQLASAFQFDNSVGHGLVADCHLRWEMYTAVEAKHKFGLEMLDKVTNGGMEMGTLNVFLAGTGVGKSLVMGDIAAKAAMAGSKVLVISLEMAEVKLAERVEANLMDVPVLHLKHMSKQDFTIKQDVMINKLKKSGGEVYFKQYPTKSAHAGHFRNLLIEYKNKLGIDFDLIVIDYLNICASQNAPKGSNSYTEVKSVAEELRALAIEFQLPIISATQTNKAGQDATDLTLDNVSESHGLSVTVDCLIGIVSHEDWEKVGQILFVQLKNRYGALDYYRKFMVGIERAKMRLYNLKIEASDQLNTGQHSQTVETNVTLDFAVAKTASAKKLSLLNTGDK
ncbi:MAG: AAA family ATPase [Gammaproteobacteria bacterium]|nr:AAA family ATPase [Gammaproteobacteria bacterium]